MFSAYALTHDGIAQARDPLDPPQPHDTFQLNLGASTTNADTVVVGQNMVTGDLFEVPAPEPLQKRNDQEG